MKLRNSTDLPEDLIREVVNFVRPTGVRNVDVYVENRSFGHGSGRASNRGYVTVRLQPDAKYPFHLVAATEGGYCFSDWVRSKEEALVLYMAHELRHQWQFGVGQSFEEMFRRAKNQRLVGYNASRVQYDPNGGEVKRGRMVYMHARVEKVRKVRRAGHRRRRGQKGGSEHDADVYAMKMLRAWRREHPVEPCWDAAGVGQ